MEIECWSLVSRLLVPGTGYYQVLKLKNEAFFMATAKTIVLNGLGYMREYECKSGLKSCSQQLKGIKNYIFVV
jgi:hypothetical protein